MPDLLLGGDRRLNRLGLGAMRLALGGSVRDPGTAVAILRKAVDLGVNHIDTAGTYGFGDLHAHELIRTALSPYPDDLVIASKVTVPTEGDAGQLRGLVEQDLRRLGLDHLDLVYLRVGGMGPAGGEPLGERFAALAALCEEGLIRHLGVSHVDATQLTEARAIAPVAAVQNHFNIRHRDDAVSLAQCEQDGIAYIPYFPLGGGRADLSGLASLGGATPAQVALAWLLAVSPVTVAIPGASTLNHLTENAAAADIQLTADELARLHS
jgi:aryl-alcohol dehydrogenase-like predicted oxidoreductase